VSPPLLANDLRGSSAAISARLIPPIAAVTVCDTSGSPGVNVAEAAAWRASGSTALDGSLGSVEWWWCEYVTMEGRRIACAEWSVVQVCSGLGRVSPSPAIPD
jgi:hypothetical protein